MNELFPLGRWGAGRAGDLLSSWKENSLPLNAEGFPAPAVASGAAAAHQQMKGKMWKEEKNI